MFYLDKYQDKIGIFKKDTKELICTCNSIQNANLVADALNALAALKILKHSVM